MEDIVPSRIINVRSENSRLTHGEKMKSQQPIPAQWCDGDCVTVIFPNDERIHLFHEAEAGPRSFSFKRNLEETYVITLDQTAEGSGENRALTATFDEALLYIQARDDEAGR